MGIKTYVITTQDSDNLERRINAFLATINEQHLIDIKLSTTPISANEYGDVIKYTVLIIYKIQHENV